MDTLGKTVLKVCHDVLLETSWLYYWPICPQGCPITSVSEADSHVPFLYFIELLSSFVVCGL